MSELTIRHTFLDGTVVEDLSYVDYVAVLKPIGTTWRWGREVSGPYLRGSRNHPARRWVLDQAAQALTAAGYTVTVTIDDTPPPMEEREADRRERMTDREDALRTKAARRITQGEAIYRRGEEFFQGIPLGQPVMPDHHSYRRDIRRRAENRARLGKGWALIASGQAAAAHADATAAHMPHRESPHVVADRLDRLRADLRDVERKLTGTDGQEHRARLTTRRDDLTDQIRYWQATRAEQIATGQATDHGPDTIGVMDLVVYRHGAYVVGKVNKKSVTIPWHSWTRTIVFHKIDQVIPRDTPRWATLARTMIDAESGGKHPMILALEQALNTYNQ